MTIKQIYRKGIVKSIKDLFDNTNSDKGDITSLLNKLKTTFFVSYTDEEHMWILFPDNIAKEIQKHFSVPELFVDNYLKENRLNCHLFDTIDNTCDGGTIWNASEDSTDLYFANNTLPYKLNYLPSYTTLYDTFAIRFDVSKL